MFYAVRFIYTILHYIPKHFLRGKCKSSLFIWILLLWVVPGSCGVNESVVRGSLADEFIDFYTIPLKFMLYSQCFSVFVWTGFSYTLQEGLILGLIGVRKVLFSLKVCWVELKMWNFSKTEQYFRLKFTKNRYLKNK